MKTTLLLAIIFLGLNGCSKSKKEETFKTQSYYDKHEKERLSRIKECKKLKDATIESMMDCDNARNAQRKFSAPLDTSGIEL